MSQHEGKPFQSCFIRIIIFLTDNKASPWPWKVKLVATPNIAQGNSTFSDTIPERSDMGLFCEMYGSNQLR